MKKEKIAIYPGTFDPFTNGHLDIVRKASELFDKVVIVIAINKNKTRTYKTNISHAAIEQALTDNGITNCIVGAYDGLIADLMRHWNAKYLIRGLRNTMDYNYEENMAEVNKIINFKIEYVYFRADNSAISSSMVKELYAYDYNISNFVPAAIKEMMDEYEEE